MGKFIIPFLFSLQLFAEEDKDKKKESVDISSIDNLQDWVDNTAKFMADAKTKAEADEAVIKVKDEKIIALEKEVSDIGDLVVINKNRWKDTDPERAKDYEFGKWLGAIQHRDFKALAAFDTKILITNRAQPDMAKIIPIGEAGKYLKNLSGIGQKIDPHPGEGFQKDLGTPLTGDATGTDAQYLVPQTMYETTILKTADALSEIIPKFTRKMMTGRLHRYPVQSTKAGFTFVTNEVTSKTEANPTWGKVDVEAETYAFWAGVTDELMEDTFADIGGEIRQQGIDAWVITVETGMLDGTGSSPTPITGILRGSTHSLVMDTNSILNADWDDLQNLSAKLTTKGKRVGAGYMMHPTIWDIFATSKDADGRFYFMPNAAVPRTARGYPIWTSDNMPDIDDDTADKAFIAFGNPTYTIFGIRMGMEFKYFTETFYAVQDDENFFRVRTRLGGIVGQPGNYAVLKTKA